MPKISAKDIQIFREQTLRIGDTFGVILTHAKSGLNVTAKMFHEHGYVIAKANGYGYDKEGQAMGDVINTLWQTELEAAFNANADTFGAVYRGKNNQIVIDGGRGKNYISRILNAIGFEVTNIGASKYVNVWVLRKVS